MSEDQAWRQYLFHLKARTAHARGVDAALGGGRWTAGSRIFTGLSQAEADRKRDDYERAADRAVGL